MHAKRILFLLITALFFVSGTSLAQTPVRVGIYQNSPLSFVDEHGVAQGIYADILRDTAAAQGWTLGFVACEWSACLDMLQTKKIDILGPIAYSDERAEIYDFSQETLLVNWGQIYLPEDSEIQSFPELDGKKIAVLNNDIYYTGLKSLLQKFDVHAEYVEVANYDDVLELVASRQVDVGLVNRFYGLLNSDSIDVKKSPMVLNPIEIRFAAPKDDRPELLADIDARLRVLKADSNSIYYRSIDRWLSGEPEQQKLPRWIMWLIGIAGLTGLLLAILSIGLRRQVAIRTRLLNSEMEGHKRTALALQASERRYRTVVENSPAPIFVHRDGRFVYLNRAAIVLHGGTKSTDFVDKNIADFLLEDDQKHFAEMKRLARLQPEKVRITETQIRQMNGNIIDSLITAMTVNFDGEPAQLVIARDITERKRAEISLRKYADELERSNRELQDFAYVASHDLQEPLRKIQIFGERLKSKYRDKLDDTGRDYLVRMDSAARRMKLLIDDLLAFSRVTTGAKPFSVINLSDVVDGVLLDLETRIAETRAKITVDELPEIEADPMQMRQLFQNLIGNALKFQREGVSPVIQICGECEAHSDNASESCSITVSDNGIGFEQEYAERIFSVFQRLHTRAEFEGTGVGLALCRKIVERHRGSIRAESEVGVGTRFIITLPLKQPPAHRLV